MDPSPPPTVRAFAARLLDARSLPDKLAAPPLSLSDTGRGPPERRAGPTRPPGLEIVPGRRVRVPPPSAMGDPAQRVRILHALANHELQAAEILAFALLAFPEAPDAFRQGCLAVLADEQRHLALYLGRLEAHGAGFGDFPVSGHFWRAMARVESPLAFVCALGVTYESANLDFALELTRAAREAGDEETARVLEQVHDDEVRHVRFGWTWLKRLGPPGADPWDTYLRTVPPPLGPSRARGAAFDRAGREAAGMEAAFLDRLERTEPHAPGGAPRR